MNILHNQHKHLLVANRVAFMVVVRIVSDGKRNHEDG